MENQVYELNPVAVIEPHQARLSITYAAQAGDLPDPIAFDLPDAQIIAIATEALRQGIPGIRAQNAPNLAGFVVERFGATADLPYARIMIRPKSEFGR